MKPIALITGACGGIGSATIKVLINHGYQVIGLDLILVATEFTLANSDDLTFYKCDICDLVTNPTKNMDIVRNIRTEIGNRGLKLLVNNAAHQNVKSVEDTSLMEWQKTMCTNVSAPFALIKEFLPELVSAKGSVCNVASIHAHLTKPGFVAYSTSKGALVSLTQALSVELACKGIRVNAVMPAATKTPMLIEGFSGNLDAMEQLNRVHPIGRCCEPHEIGEFIEFLASNNASYITGSALPIDGGISHRLHDPL